MKPYQTFFLTGVILLFAVAHAQTQPVSVPDSSIAKSADELEWEADSLEKRALELEHHLDSLETSSSVNSGDSAFTHEIARIKREMVELKDKIKASVAAALHKVEFVSDEEERPPEKVRVIITEPVPPCKKGSGAFMLSFEYTDFDVAPLQQLAKNDRSLSGIPLSVSDTRMLTLGFTGYHSDDQHVRLGNGLYLGYKSFNSDIYSRLSDTSDTAIYLDSIVTLRVIPIYYGFLCEKAFRYEQADFFAGIMIGGHVTVVVKEEQSAELISSFISDETSEEGDDGRFSVALSPAIFGDIHGGISFALSERLHAGIDGVIRCAYAYEGFGPGFGDYFTVSPGIRLRLSFGKAG